MLKTASTSKGEAEGTREADKIEAEEVAEAEATRTTIMTTQNTVPVWVEVATSMKTQNMDLKATKTTIRKAVSITSMKPSEVFACWF